MEIEGRPQGRLCLDEHFLRSPDPGVFFLFVEKVGCTLLKSILLREMIGDMSAIQPAYALTTWSRRDLVHAFSYEVLRADGRRVVTDGDARWVTFCRNPYDRFASAFLDKIVSPSASEIDHYSWIRREVMFRQAREVCRSGHPGVFDATISLKEFARYVAATPPLLRDRHWAEQHLLNLADLVRPFAVVKLEDFDQAFPAVWQSLFGVALRPTAALQSNRTERPGRLFDEETAALVHDVYRRDFDLFDYPEDSWRLF